MWSKTRSWILNNEAIILILCASVLIRLPSWFEPYWYGDEAIYLTIGQAITNGVTLYSGIHDNKPPFLYLIAGLVSGDQFWFKFIATAWNLLSIVVFAKLAERITTKKKLVFWGTVMFAFLTAWPKLEGNIANAELFFILPTSLAMLTLWRKEAKLKQVFWAGMLLGAGGLFKMPAIIESGVWPLVWLVFRDRNWGKKVVVLGLGVGLPIVVSLGYFWLQGAGGAYLTAAWAQNVPYLSSWKSASQGQGVYSLSGRLSILMVLLAMVLGLAKKWGKNVTIVSSWLGLTLFAALLSGRPYPHYLLQCVGPAVLSGMLIWEEKKFGKLMSGLVLMCLWGAIWVFHFYNYPVVGYYRNFWEWTLGRKTVTEYLSWFGAGNSVNYEVAAWVKTLTVPGEKIFVWGDQPMVYAITKRPPVGKYTVKYHIKDFQAEAITMHELRTTRPRVVVSYGQENELPGLEELLASDYEIEKIVEGVKIFIKKN